MKILKTRCLKLIGTLASIFVLACSDQQADAVDVVERIVVEGSACKVVYEVTSDWGSGFTANVLVTNRAAAQNVWKLEWDFSSAQRITSLWDGTHTQDGAHVTVTGPGWARALASGATARFGFNGSLSGANQSPRAFLLNGTSCGESKDTPSGSGGSGGSGGGTSNGTGGSGGQSNGGCTAAPKYAPGKAYNPGQRVEVDGKIYECREFPFSGWCGIGGAYAPNGAHGSDAWTQIGDCLPGSGNGSGGSSGNNTGGSGGTGGSKPIDDSPIGKPKTSLPKHALVGYWHNFSNPSGPAFPLRQVSDAWDVIVIAFAENDPANSGAIKFTPDRAINAFEFKADVAAKRAAGKVIVLSLGGAEGTITLNTQADEDRFVGSAIEILNTWGFDGLDIDLESGSGLVHGSQIQQRLISAMRRIKQSIGERFYLSMAPEHPYVQGGHIAYSGIWGAYLPLIDALRADLDLLHVQLYNNGGLQTPYAGQSFAAGTTDMLVASVKMLVDGFETAGGPRFKGLRPDQVAIGVPSGPSSANSGLASNETIINATKCITLGTNCGSLKMNKPEPSFRGVMTWSINWDKHDGMRFSSAIGPFLDSL